MSEPGGGRNLVPPAWVFEGPVECAGPLRTDRWRLCGRLAALQAGGKAGAAELLLSGVHLPGPLQGLPAKLHDLRVQAIPEARTAAGESTARPAPWRLELESRDLTLTLQVDSVHLHRDASQAFFSAVPGAVLSSRTRLGWALLLTLLRVPLVARLINRSSQ